MLSRLLSKQTTSLLAKTSLRSFSNANVGLGDIGDVTKVHYTEEFDQGLTDEQKASMKRFDIYRSNPNDP